MNDWLFYICAFIFFFISHSVPVRPNIKARVAAVIEAKGFTLAYSLLSSAALILLILGARSAPYLPLWHWQEWHNHLAMALMLIATLILALAIGRPNPLSFGGAGNARFDPTAPGLIGWAHHPLLLALFLWSAAHLLANGDLAHVIMFGCFAGFSLLGRKMINRRKIRAMGQAEWARLAETTRQIRPTLNGIVRLGLGGLAYGLLVWAHEHVIGISPLP